MHILKLAFGMLLWLAAPVHADTVHVAVAANFRTPVQVLQARFTDDTGHRLNISTGATGQLFAQISHGAPFDVFLSADQARPEELIRTGKAIPGSQFTYAIGRLYLLLPKQPAVSAATPELSGIRRISIANPRTAPYGSAARQVLGKLNFPDGAPQIAQAQSIAGVNAAVASRAVDAGFAAYASVANASEMPPGWLVPQDLHDPIRQDAVLLTQGSANTAAVSFLNWLQTSTAQQIIREHGYHVD